MRRYRRCKLINSDNPLISELLESPPAYHRSWALGIYSHVARQSSDDDDARRKFRASGLDVIRSIQKFVRADKSSGTKLGQQSSCLDPRDHASSLINYLSPATSTAHSFLSLSLTLSLSLSLSLSFSRETKVSGLLFYQFAE